MDWSRRDPLSVKTVTMNVNLGDADQDLNEMLLLFLGTFANLQDMIDHLLAKAYFAKRIPKVADIVHKRVVSRIKDDEREELFQAIAADLDTDAELDNFKRVFNSVKKLRDRAAHAASITVISEDAIRVVPSYMPITGSGPPPSTEIGRQELADAIKRGYWLTIQVLYVTSEGGLYTYGSSMFRPGSTFLRYRRPTSDPDDWDGVVFHPVPEVRL